MNPKNLSRREALGMLVAGSLATLPVARLFKDKEYRENALHIIDMEKSYFLSFPKLLQKANDSICYNHFFPKGGNKMYQYPLDVPNVEFTCSGRKPLNILLFEIDTLRRDTGAFGECSQMPRLEELMKRKGAVVFRNAVSNGAYTRPGSISMCTGLLPFQIGLGRRYLSPYYKESDIVKRIFNGEIKSKDRPDNMEEQLRALGYLSENKPLSSDSWFCGTCLDVDVGIQLKKLGFDTFLCTPNPYTLFDRRDGYKVLETKKYLREYWLDISNFCDYLEYAEELLFSKRNKPFFLMINPLEMHHPRHIRYNCVDNEELKMIRETIGFPWGDFGCYGNLDTIEYPENARACRALYDYNARHLDIELTEFLERVFNDSNLRDNTLVIITSDHGEEFGNHRSLIRERIQNDLQSFPLLDCSKEPFDISGYAHGFSFNRDVTGIPLAIMGPNVRKFQFFDGLVSSTDIAATIFEQASLNVDGLEGFSLLSKLRNRPFVLSEDSNTRNLGIGMTYPNGDVVQIFPFEDPRNISDRIDYPNFCFGPNPQSVLVETGNVLRQATLREIKMVLRDLKRVYPDHPMIPNLEKLV